MIARASSRIHLAREEVGEGERRDRAEPPVQRRQDEELHPDDRLRVENVTRTVYLSVVYNNVQELVLLIATSSDDLLILNSSS